MEIFKYFEYFKLTCVVENNGTNFICDDLCTSYCNGEIGVEFEHIAKSIGFKGENVEFLNIENNAAVDVFSNSRNRLRLLSFCQYA